MNVDLSPSDSLSSLTSDGYDRRVRGVRPTQRSRRNVSLYDESHKRDSNRLQRLTDDLHEANRTIHSNQQLLRNYHQYSKQQSSELSQLKNELELSRNRLHLEKQHKRSKDEQERARRLLMNEEDMLLRERRLADQLEMEHQERLRLQSEKAHALDMLHESIRQKDHHHHSDLQTLLGEIQAMRADMLKSSQHHVSEDKFHQDSQSTSANQMKMIQKEISSLHETLAGDQDLLKQNCTKVDQLSGKVNQLFVDQSQSRSSKDSSQDNCSLWSEKELKHELAALKQELIQSEAERMHLSQQCDMYADLSDKQKLLCGTSVREVHKLEDSLQAVENERDVALVHCKRLEELLGRAENQLKASQAQCDVLQENVDTLKRSEAKRQQLSSEVEGLLKRIHEQGLQLTEQDKQNALLREEALSASNQLKVAKQEASATIKKLRSHCRAQNEELRRVREENVNLTALYESALTKSHRSSKSDRGFVPECDYLELKAKIAEIESSLTQCKMEKTQIEVELQSTQSTVKQKCREIDQLKADLATSHYKAEELSRENIELTEKLQTSIHKLSSEKQVLKTEMQDSVHKYSQETAHVKLQLSHAQSEKSTLKQKVTQLQQINQNFQSQLLAATNNLGRAEHDIQRLEQRLSETKSTHQGDLADNDRKYDESIKMLKDQHKDELSDLQRQHSVHLEELQGTVAKLQVQLEDKESMLRALRRQQVKVFTDQQRIGDDLNKSLEDTEKLRRKYIAARKYYEDKLNALESEVADSDSLMSNKLKKDLRKTQQNMSQIIEDYELVLATACEEIDNLASKFGYFHGDVSIFCEDSCQDEHLKKWIANVMAKLKWIQREVDKLKLKLSASSPLMPH